MARSVVVGFTLCLVPNLLNAGVSETCREATSLWAPSGDASDSHVVKWERQIGYQITAGQSASALVSSIEGSLNFQSNGSGLEISVASGVAVDLFIGVVPDIRLLASPAFQKSLSDYFQDFNRRSGNPGGFKIDGTTWERALSNVVPKCFGMAYTDKYVRKRAFLAVQQRENAACVDIGLGEILGLSNIRTYYLNHGSHISRALITLGLQTLYEPMILSGMTNLDVNSKLGDICDGR